MAATKITPDETMQEIKEWMSQTGIVLGNLTQYYGGWDILLHNGSWAVLQEKDARHYITGFLHDWYVKLPPDVDRIDIDCKVLESCLSDEYLSALWRAYKFAEKVDVVKDSPTLDDLAKGQGVKPMTDVGTIVGTWPGEVDDGFEQAVDDLRKGK